MNLEQKDYYWVRQGQPKDYKRKRRAEKLKQPQHPGYRDPELEDFRAECWIRRLAGMWFYNGKEATPTYITGLHWYYLENIFIGNPENNGYPNYWESDKEIFYVIQHVLENPYCFGLIYATKRREGKSSKSVAFGLDPSTRMKYANCGIQSKTEKDAKDVIFRDGFVRAVDKLPDYFMPIFDTSGGLRPKTRYHFIHPPRKGKAALEEFEIDELGGWIDWRSSKESSYDGTKLRRYIGDEVFKTEGVDIRERHRVVRFCLTGPNGEVVGKALYTSTCEEIVGHIEDYIQFWKDSDQTKKDSVTKRTRSGLYRYFLPADQARNRDKYGRCDVEANRAMIIAERESVRDDPEEYNSIVRKEPLTIQEAFRVANRSSVYNTIALNDQLEKVMWAEEEIVEEGVLDWDESGDQVVWYPQKGGTFRRRKRYTWPTKNPVRTVRGIVVPDDTGSGVVGADPFDHKLVEDVARASRGAAHAYAKYDPMRPDETDTFVIEYAERPADPKEYYKGVLMICIYLGWKVVAESNRVGLINWFTDNGWGNFLVKPKGRQAPGLPAHTKTIESMVSVTKSWIARAIEKMVFKDTIKDKIDFDPNNTQKFDLAMSAGYALIGESSIKDKEEEQSGKPDHDVYDLFGRRK